VPPSIEQKRSAEKLVQRFELSRSRVLPYLTGRGLADAAERFRLGFVEPADDVPRQYWNRMSIPYLTPTGPVQIRYRCIAEHDCKTTGCSKYLGDKGVEVTIYNPGTLLDARGPVILCEGELDAIAVETIAGLPAVGIPGVQSWKRHPYWARCFVGLELILFGDGDDAGDDLAATIAADLPEIRHVRAPDGDDANSVLARDPAEFLQRCGLADPPAPA
jgi:DNA primase